MFLSRTAPSPARRVATVVAALVTALLAAVLISTQPTSAATPAASGAPAAEPLQDQPPMAENDFPVTREAAYGDNRYTVFRPEDPQALGTPMPVLAFGNGACAHNNNSEVLQALTFVASKGFVVVNTGSADGSGTGVPDGQVLPGLLTDAITWAEQEQQRAGSPLYQRLDLTKVATAGHSCGGIEAMVAAQDERVGAAASVSSGFLPDGSLGGYTPDELDRLHSPILFIDGGPNDIAYNNSQANYNRTTVPAVVGTQPYAGHVGFITGAQMAEGMTVMVSFFDMVLNENEVARSYILDPSGLASQAPWQVRTKNF